MNIEFSTAFTRELPFFIRTSAPSNLFGDKKTREAYSPEDALQKFTEVWEQGLKEEVLDADFCTAEEASKHLSDFEIRRYFEQDQKHKLVTYEGKLFLVQLFELDQEKRVYELEHIWYVGEREIHGPQDYDPRHM